MDDVGPRTTGDVISFCYALHYLQSCSFSPLILMGMRIGPLFLLRMMVVDALMAVTTSLGQSCSSYLCSPLSHAQADTDKCNIRDLNCDTRESRNAPLLRGLACWTVCCVVRL